MTILVLMGVSGSGKTTIGAALAERLGWQFLEGDALHPPSNVAKMAAGTPLQDEDRWPWLRAIAARIDEWHSRGVSGVVACSALKRAYRDILNGPRADVRLVYLHGTYDMIALRLTARRGHFMPPALLESQFRALEEPSADEVAMIVSIGNPPDFIIGQILEQIG